MAKRESVTVDFLEFSTLLMIMLEESEMSLDDLTYKIAKNYNYSISSIVSKHKNYVTNRYSPNLKSLQEILQTLNYDMVFVPKENNNVGK